MKRGWLLVVVLVLVVEIAIGWLDPWEVRWGRWPPPAVTVVFLLVLLGAGAARTRCSRRVRAAKPPGVAPSAAARQDETRDSPEAPPTLADTPW